MPAGLRKDAVLLDCMVLDALKVKVAVPVELAIAKGLKVICGAKF